MKLYLLRHGITEANEKRLYCGWSDIPLSKEGKAQLELLREQALYPDIKGLKVYTSGMRRAVETLEILYGNVAHEIIEDFKEMNFGDFEMKSYEELKYTPAYQAWLKGCNEMNQCPNGESGEAMKTRALRGLKQLIAKDEDCLVVCHGGIIASIMENLFPQYKRNRYQWQPEGGKGYALIISQGVPKKFELIPY